eukprot:1171666-Prymnesium_polylepis.1
MGEASPSATDTQWATRRQRSHRGCPEGDAHDEVELENGSGGAAELLLQPHDRRSLLQVIARGADGVHAGSN